MKGIIVFCSLLAGAFALIDCDCTFEYDPVCGSDGKTYSNMCEFECAQEKRPGMSLVGHMECGDIILELASCICTMEYSPVCGSDGKTYGNLCTFKCAQRDNSALTLVGHDACGSVLEEKHFCVCTEEYSPVCGSDGQTYSNLCLFKCAQRDNPDLILQGHFKCLEIPTPRDACVCTREYDPVCGSDGVTYGNPCELRCAMSKTPGLKFSKNRACEDDFIIRAFSDPCVCTREYNPVCGSDGLSYGNPCMFRCAASKNSALRFVKYGACEDDIPSYQDPCVCTREFNPVCGSDGLSYGNPCMLRCAMSKTPGLKFVKYGECGRQNFLNLYSAPSCACNKMFRPVCGSDGKTYSNPCLFNCAKKQNSALKIVKQGACGTSFLQSEPLPTCACDRSFEPVCASDGITYNNLCMFECAQKQKPELKLVKKGHCYNFLMA